MDKDGKNPKIVEKKVCPDVREPNPADAAKPRFAKQECGTFTAIGSIKQEKCVPKSLCF